MSKCEALIDMKTPSGLFGCYNTNMGSDTIKLAVLCAADVPVSRTSEAVYMRAGSVFECYCRPFCYVVV